MKMAKIATKKSAKKCAKRLSKLKKAKLIDGTSTTPIEVI
jgi:hypothetical protein